MKHTETKVTIAVDAMGGDHGASVVIPSLVRVSQHYTEGFFILYGDEAQIEAQLSEHPSLRSITRVEHCEMAIPMDMKPARALRVGRRVSSMWQAIEAVKAGQAQACLSAGNTGALMAMSKIILRTHAGIERPPIAGLWPTLEGESVVLDVGATIGGTASQYVQFAVMGVAYAKIVLGLDNPRVALLNIGIEDIKGTDSIKHAAELLSSSNLNFIGFIEADAIGRGEADVVVTDGFTGNVAVKAAEGTSRQISAILKISMERSLMARLGFFLARGAFTTLRGKMNPNASNGGMLLGLRGSVIKSHGGVDAEGFAIAAEVAIEVAKADIASVIERDIEAMQTLLDEAWAEEVEG
ncbi:MAG: phosphate acyltransferase PlsX [Alphaproteobacteria bacterium]|nr:phosphate acyltransferase PlsX [Alphaproteobacteria bacterium]MBE8220900.1 phosphate acyltransferase PlsX [Alphaproteobacteria bacterium]